MSTPSSSAGRIGSSEVTALLADGSLEALRHHYDRAALSQAACQAMVNDYPASRDYVMGAHASLYACGEAGEPSSSSGLSPAERESALLVLLASQRAEFELAVHIYWSLMEGLSPAKIAALIMLAGVYSGIGVQTTGMKVMRKTLARLDAQACEHREASGDQLGAAPVLFALVDVFD